MKKRRYKIVFIDHTTKMGGGQVYLLRQLSQLDKAVKSYENALAIKPD